jgi:hypothetical protein
MIQNKKKFNEILNKFENLNKKEEDHPINNNNDKKVKKSFIKKIEFFENINKKIKEEAMVFKKSDKKESVSESLLLTKKMPIIDISSSTLADKTQDLSFRINSEGEERLLPSPLDKEVSEIKEEEDGKERKKKKKEIKEKKEKKSKKKKREKELNDN